MQAKRLFLAAVILLLVFNLGAPRASALTGEELLDRLRSWYEEYAPDLSVLCPMPRELLARAEPDECFVGIGDEGNVYDPNLVLPCPEGDPKINQAYVWGLTQAGDDLWFGTAPNVLCLVFGTYLGSTSPHQTDCWVCEFGESKFSPPYPAALGDLRPSRVFVFNLPDRTLTEKTPPDPRLLTTLGLRSAGSLDDVVIMGGPGMPAGLNLFAWNAATGAYLGSVNLPAYNNIRKWLVADGVLYTTVGSTGGGGKVLRWRGDAANPFVFEVVGDIDGAGAELAEHEGRLFVSTWPSPPIPAGLWMSPFIPAGGLTEDDSGDWRKVWRVDDYEPNPINAAAYGGGALASFGGRLYWGTMHVPFTATLAHIQFYGPPESPEDLLATVLGSWRAISIFRGEFGEDWETVELLYGMPLLPVFVPPVPGPEPEPGYWTLQPNNMGALPRYGISGFGNFFNNYTWTMDVFDGQLFVGTMDFSLLVNEMLRDLLPGGELDSSLGQKKMTDIFDCFFGADLWRFPSPDCPAIPESLNGVGNKMNYGIRTMLSADSLYLGTANPMNLSPDGGWELIRLYKAPTPVVTPTPIPPARLVVDGKDYDGDGRDDIVVWRPADGRWVIDFGSPASPAVFYYGRDGDIPASGDYNGDGMTDPAVFRPETGLWAVRDLTRFYFGREGDVPVPSDYSGDGSTDAGIFRPGTGLWAIRGVTRTYFGQSGDIPIPDYYHGDGTALIALYRPASGLWALRGATRAYFGAPGDWPAPAHYTGEAFPLSAVFRPASGLWAIRGATRAYFGREGDYPLPGNYLGDGFDHSAIYRPSTGLWAIRGVTRVYWGGGDYIPVSW